MKNLFYCTKKNVYQITKNEDGTVTFYPEEKNAGSIILQRGSVEAFLSHCIQDERSYEDFRSDVELVKKKQNEYRAAMRMQNAIAKQEKARTAYHALLDKYGIIHDYPKEGGVIEATKENLLILMQYLQTVNWGMWQLPRLTQGYTAHQHDCDGTIAVTITLDEGILSEGKLYKKLQYGAPMRYLTQYAPVGRLSTQPLS